MPLPRVSTLLLCLATLLVSASGCSKSTKPKVVTPPAITQAQADFIAQELGAEVASDNGGLFYLIQSLSAMIHGSPPTPAPAETLLSKGGTALLKYRCTTTYLDSLGGIQGGRDSLTVSMRAFLKMDIGGDSLNANGVVGRYFFLTDQDTAEVNMEDLRTHAVADYIEFQGLISDTTFALVTGQFSAGTPQLWRQSNVLSIDTVRVHRSDLLNPFPFEGNITWLIIQADLMPDRSPASTPTGDVAGEAVVRFNGTRTAILEIADTPVDPTVSFSYQVDLITGQLTKIVP